MTVKTKIRKKALSDAEIDKLVEAQAADDSAWDEPIQVSAKPPASLSLPAELAARAAFVAHLHREPDTKDWLRRIIAERIELEESAFIGFKKELAANQRT